MTRVLIFHNPTAGDAAHDKRHLVDAMKNQGYEPVYQSVKKPWKELPTDVDMVVIAGGDGTVRKVVLHFVETKSELLKKPMAVIPLGTANNIATTLQVTGGMESIIAGWKYAVPKAFHVNTVDNGKELMCMIEGIGCGVFPHHIQDMIKTPTGIENPPEARMEADLQRLLKNITLYTPDYCELVIDGLDHSGKYMLIEVMNIRSVGSNLFLSPEANPFDEKLDVVMLKEEDKEKFANYVYDKIRGKESHPGFPAMQASKVSFRCEHNLYHIDDELFKNKDNGLVHVSSTKKTVDFLVP